MAIEAAMKQAVRRIARALRAYASAQGWQPDDYRIFLRLNELWGQIHAIVVAKAFPGKDMEEGWLSVIEFLEKELKDDPPLLVAFHLVVHTFDQVAEGGL